MQNNPSTNIYSDYPIYTAKGWLDIPGLEAAFPAWLYVIIGKRQVGKTYGVLKYMLDEGRPHFLLRRTVAELDLIAGNTDLSPYNAFYPTYQVGLFKNKGICSIAEYDMDDKGKPYPVKPIGVAMGLPTIANIRGFNGAAFTDLVFDEFIPERHVVQRKTEGDAFLNAYTSINGNRELEGKPPLKAWLLANANSISSPIMEALNLGDIVMALTEADGAEVYYDGNICVCMPKSENVMKQRKSTKLMELLTASRSADKFMAMAVENKFSYDDLSKVRRMNVRNCKPLFNFADLFYGWLCEDNQSVYICRYKNRHKAYADTTAGRENLISDYCYLYDLYGLEKVYFSDPRVLAQFCRVFAIDFSA